MPSATRPIPPLAAGPAPPASAGAFPPGTVRDIIALVEAGKVHTRPWMTDRFELADTAAVFPRDIAGNPAVLKAMIEV